MANSEDYLDGLLNSVQSVRSDVKRAEEMAEESRKQREEQRNKISPNDDFMKASGLDDYMPEPASHANLRKAFSEEDFLREFEEDLVAEETDVDALIRDFEREIDLEEREFNGEDISSFMESIEDIVSQAKEQIEQGDDFFSMPQVEELDEEEDEAKEEVAEESISEEMEEDVEEEFPPIDGYSSDELGGLIPDVEEEEEMLDENDSDMDLMDLLSGDEQFGDIGDLLQADESDETLEEAQEEFDLQADAEGNIGEDDTEETKDEGEKIGLLDKIRALFSKKKKGEGDDKVLDISQDAEEDVSQENLDILKSLDKAEKEGEEKTKKRREKKEKEPKEKKQRPPREKKPKKEKVPDNSPKIPSKLIFIFVLAGLSIVVLITLGQKSFGYRLTLSNARAAYVSGNYFESYEELMGVELKKDDIELFKKARLLGDLQKRNREYQVLMTYEKYPLVLDSLVIGVARYEEHYEEAKKLGIEKEYKALGETLVQLLSDQFGVSKEVAVDLYKLNREEYSMKLDEILDNSNL